MSLVALIGSLLIGGSAVGAVIAFALRLDSARVAERDASVALAKQAAELSITKATLETTDRLRLAEKERARALEDELAALDRDVAVPGGPSARERVLLRWKAANAIAAGDAGADRGGSPVPERPAAPAAGSGSGGKAG